jgi:hypothetical protein
MVLLRLFFIREGRTLWQEQQSITPIHPNTRRNTATFISRDDCHDGKAIKPAHRKSGDGGKPRCKVCIKLG